MLNVTHRGQEITLNFKLPLNISLSVLPRFGIHNFLFLANYGLPEDETDAVIPMFKEVTFTELDREEAVKVIELYNKVAKEKGYGKKHEDRKMKKFKAGNQRPGNFKGTQNNRG